MPEVGAGPRRTEEAVLIHDARVRAAPRAGCAALCGGGPAAAAADAVAIQNLRVLYRKATERTTEMLDDWQVEHQVDHERVAPALPENHVRLRPCSDPGPRGTGRAGNC